MSILKKIVENTRENLKAKKAKLSLEDVTRGPYTWRDLVGTLL